MEKCIPAGDHGTVDGVEDILKALYRVCALNLGQHLRLTPMSAQH
jgi:hypothetical protein